MSVQDVCSFSCLLLVFAIGCVCVCLGCAGMWPPSPCLSDHRERLGEGCVCVCVCVFYVSCSPNSGAKGSGVPLFFRWLGGSRTGGEGL